MNYRFLLLDSNRMYLLQRALKTTKCENTNGYCTTDRHEQLAPASVADALQFTGANGRMCSLTLRTIHGISQGVDNISVIDRMGDV